MNRFENMRIMLRETQKEINELENIASMLDNEIMRQKRAIDKATDYISKNITDYKVVQELERILRGEK